MRTLHVGVLYEGIEEVGGLDEGKATVAERGDWGVHSDSLKDE